MGRKKHTVDVEGTSLAAADVTDSDTIAVEGIASNGASPPTDQLFDLDQLRVSQNFADAIGVKKALLTVPVRKPHRQEWLRVHPDEAFRLVTYILELKDEREWYLVHPQLAGAVSNEVATMQLFTAINRQGTLFLWPVRLPDPSGRRNEWNTSALQAADVARTRWIRMGANFSLQAYDLFVTEGTLDEPEWPDVNFQALVNLAFRGRLITSPDHDVLLRLRGQK
jgi:hypothetical protein